MFSIVSRCLCVFMFCLVVLSFVHVQCGVGVHGVCVSVVVCHNIVLCCCTQQQTHTMNTDTTLHRKTGTNTLILIFNAKQTYQMDQR